jgi:hypothetical protein
MAAEIAGRISSSRRSQHELAQRGSIEEDSDEGFPSRRRLGAKKRKHNAARSAVAAITARAAKRAAEAALSLSYMRPSQL